jgi:acyl carrier protein
LPDNVTDELERFIVKEIAQGAGIATIGPDDDLLADGIIDSHGLMEVVGFIESRYGFAVADEDLLPENFQSLQSIAAYVERKAAR